LPIGAVEKAGHRLRGIKGGRSAVCSSYGDRLGGIDSLLRTSKI